ncbi:uncharacterized protein LOC112562532 isoform X2 [Pomacea canaliculata]|uniref:uncharacterized protein LOC112562532 isoform X2 n=1 Tax=Pomacea canaliculata TaxID=400727 RepID=UPI000D734885|nr:uncharacterized protein LOC112562532 isoform X2 [Pomacea canaliculata]
MDPKRTVSEGEELSSSNPSKKQRRANWTSREIWMLLEEVKLERECIMCPQTNETSNKKKAVTWQKIADRLTATCGVDIRTAQNVREKWGFLKSDAQSRRHKQKTLGGGAVKESEYDNMILEIIGEDSALIDGINAEPLVLLAKNNAPVHEENIPQPQEDIPLTPSFTERVLDLEHDVSQISKGKKNEKKSVLQYPFAESSLMEEFLKSEIERNKSIVELNKLKAEKLKLEIERLKGNQSNLDTCQYT